MNPLLYPIIIPFALGLICFCVPRRIKGVREFLAVVGSLATFGICIWLFIQRPLQLSFNDTLILNLDQLSSFILLASGLFGFLIVLYSLKFMSGKKGLSAYYGSLLLTLALGCGAILANHLVILLVLWGFLGVTLFGLVLSGGEEAGSAAKKTLVIVGGSDALLMLGIVLLYSLTSSFAMDSISVGFETTLAYVAFIMLALAAFAKAGAMPLHTWIPDVAEKAPIPVTAYLPAALDKLLGIYLLARMTLHLFVMNASMNIFLMVIGTITIIAAVMMALIQHDFRRLLAYHAVSQVGYMVLGIGTGNPIGIAGGLFHMLNHSIYKACLFLTGGSVQYRTNSADLKKLGGIGKLMPLTFTCFIIAAFAISGIPPLNGFFSKWMVYQGLIQLGESGDRLWIIWLVAAMFGSGLTLASFMKLTHAIFLGVPGKNIKQQNIREVGFGMALPMVVLALLCVVFGIFAFSLPIKHFLEPVIPNISFSGIWVPDTATALIILGLIVGLVIYLLGNLKGVREANTFVGGEKIPVEERVTGIGFYNTIREMGGINRFYKWAEAKLFDIYDQGIHLSENIASFFRKIHTGELNLYLLWVVMGLIILLVIMVGR